MSAKVLPVGTARPVSGRRPLATMAEADRAPAVGDLLVGWSVSAGGGIDAVGGHERRVVHVSQGSSTGLD